MLSDHPTRFTLVAPALKISIQSLASKFSSARPLAFAATNSWITKVPGDAARVTAHAVPGGTNALPAVSRMPGVAAHENVTAPTAGCANVKTYGPAPLPVTAVAAAPLMFKSTASTPLTISLNVTLACVSMPTVAPFCGSSACIS